MANDILATIEAIYAAGLDAELWPQALAAITQTIGGIGATLELFDRRTLAHLDFFGFGVPPIREIAYLEHYAAFNPRIPDALRRKAGEATWDYGILDEKGIDHSPFYQEFLAPMDMRYNVIGVFANTDTEFGAFSVQRSARQGHVGRAEILLTRRLTSHVGRAIDMMRRLRTEKLANQSLVHALDWLADGIALIRADGTIAHANDAFRAILHAGDGIRVKKNAIEFASSAARSRLDAALAEVAALKDGAAAAATADFATVRPSGAAPYVVSVRPIKPSRQDNISRPAVAIVFIRDPLDQDSSDISLLRELFGFTNAEASLALALRRGVSPGDYGRSQRVSLNTVYTHLRRIKEKTGCRRLPELVGRLNEVRMLLRRSSPA
jgi:DNA-binding CsgD family transcriptional regulator/PAS domain-containing protein